MALTASSRIEPNEEGGQGNGEGFGRTPTPFATPPPHAPLGSALPVQSRALFGVGFGAHPMCRCVVCVWDLFLGVAAAALSFDRPPPAIHITSTIVEDLSL